MKFDEKYDTNYIQRQWYEARDPGLHLLVPLLTVIEKISQEIFSLRKSKKNV